jgi:hypothetical protein
MIDNMSTAEDFVGGYRVKFVDVRVNPPGGRRKSARAGAAEVRRCEQKGCDDIGDCKAPRAAKDIISPAPGQRVREEDNHHWFCRRHAAEFNQSYDFFDGMTEAEIRAFHEASFSGHKPTWKFGAGRLGAKGQAYNPKLRQWAGRAWFDPNAEEARPTQVRERTRLQARALDEMNLPHEATPEQVRAKYAELVKQFHPDSNGGDRSMEPRLTIVIRAFKALKSSGLA